MDYDSYRLVELDETTLGPALAFLSRVFPPEKEEIRDCLLEALRDHDGFCERCEFHRVRRFVLLDGDEVIATTGYYATAPDTAWLSWFAVRKDLRSLGIGERLLERTMEIARQDGYESMHIWTNLHNDGAVDFYQRAGFEPYRIEPKDDYRIVKLQQSLTEC